MTIIIVLAIAVVFLAIGGMIALYKMEMIFDTLGVHDLRLRRLEDSTGLNVVRGPEGAQRMFDECRAHALVKSDFDMEREGE